MRAHKQSTLTYALAGLLAFVAIWAGLALAFPAYGSSLPIGGTPGNGCTPIYSIQMSASLTWNPGFLGIASDNVAVANKQVTETISCAGLFSIVAPWAVFSGFSIGQNGQFQVVTSMNQMNSQTVTPQLVSSQAVTVALYTANNIAPGNYQLTGNIQEQSCTPLIGCAFGSSWSTVGQFSCSFQVSTTVASGSVTKC